MLALGTACAVENEEPTLQTGGESICFSATMPDAHWAVATRALPTGYGNMTINYTNYKGEEVVHNIPDENIVMTDGEAQTQFRFATTGELVWAQIAADESGNATFYLNFTNPDGVTFYATTTVEHGTAEVGFGDVKPTEAKLTVNLTLLHNMPTIPAPEEFTVTLSARGKSEVYNPRTNGDTYPTVADAATTTFALTTAIEDNYLYGSAVSGYTVLPEQTIGDVLTITYNNATAENPADDICWTVDLSAVAVSGGESGQKANELYAGQQLILNLQAGSTTIGDTSIEIEAFVKGDDKELEGSAVVGYTYDETTNTYSVYNTYGLEAWLEAYKSDPTTNLNVEFISNTTDITLPQSALSNAPEAFVIETIDGVATLTWGGYVWKSVTLEDSAGEILGTMGFVESELGEHLTITIGEVVYAVIDGSIEGTQANLDGMEALITTLITLESPISHFYVIGELSTISGGMSNALSLVGGAIFNVYWVENTYPYLSLWLADAQTIPNEAFWDCSKISSVVAQQVTNIQRKVFFNCWGLTSLTFERVIESVDSNAFQQTNNANCTLYLNSEQSSSSIAPDDNSWGGVVWNSIVLQ